MTKKKIVKSKVEKKEDLIVPKTEMNSDDVIMVDKKKLTNKVIDNLEKSFNNIDAVDKVSIMPKTKDKLKKKKIICIIGESGTGKSTMAEFIKQHYKINMIESYTDRPKRTDWEQGHAFVSRIEFDNLKKEDMIAYTQFGAWRYCCLHKDVEDTNTYVIDEDGLTYLKKHFSELYNIVSVRLKRDENAIKSHNLGKSRLLRDEGRFNKEDKYFDYIINQGVLGINEFKVEICKCIDKIIEK